MKRIEPPIWSLWLVVLLATAQPAESAIYANCKNGHTTGADRTIIFTPNINSFMSYSQARGLGWTEAMVRRELTAALEEWTHKSEANIRVLLSNGTTAKVGWHNDELNVISICDPSVTCSASYCCNSSSSCGGQASPYCTGAPNFEITNADVVLHNRSGSNCPDWNLQKDLFTEADANQSLYSYVLHEVGHALGLDHYPANGPFFSVMMSGGAGWHDSHNLNLHSIQWVDIVDMGLIYGIRSDPIRAKNAVDSGNPLVWASGTGQYGVNTLETVGALQSTGGNQVFFARVTDGTHASDLNDINGLSAYRFNGGWGVQLIHAMSSDGHPAVSGPALAATNQEYVIAWHNHFNQIRTSKTQGGSTVNWWNSPISSVYTSQTPALAYLPSVNRLYRLYTNDAPGSFCNCGTQYRIYYQASSDHGATWGPLYAATFQGQPIMTFGGVAFTCLGTATTWPCSVAYQDWNDFRPLWRSVQPDPGDPNKLNFGAAAIVGVNNDFTTRSWGVTTGRAAGLNDETVFAASYDRNGDEPLPDHAARALHGTSTLANYTNRSLAVGGGRNVWISDTEFLNSSPVIGHYRSFDKVYMFFTKQE
ncbi:MAG: hypothetical protein L6Q92_16735 [Phycisphaerae bacterium]|nr:hypothetical protein [Phycisphaerae bacterium]